MTEPERTDDGRYIIVKGRRWRASDPHIPEKLRAELVAELMLARRMVRTDEAAARPRVHDAKVALGERGEPWWEQASDEGLRQRLGAAIRAILRHRGEATMCPSDAARIVGGDNWRDLMPAARSVAWELMAADIVEVRQKGERVASDDVSGPIRLAAGPRLQQTQD